MDGACGAEPGCFLWDLGLGWMYGGGDVPFSLGLVRESIPLLPGAGSSRGSEEQGWRDVRCPWAGGNRCFWAGRRVQSARLGPSPPRLLTEEEYRLQGEEETRKALEELRNYCRSPDFSAWTAISRIHSPKR